MREKSIENSNAPAAESARFATGTVIVAAFALFALVQAGFVLVRQQAFDLSAAIALAKAGVIAALPTVLGLALLVVLARRWHPAVKRGDRQRATRSLLFAAVAAVSAWMIVDAWVAGPLIAAGFEVWIELAAPVAIGIVVARRPPSARFCRRASPLAIVALLLLFIPVAPPSGPGGAGGPAVNPGEAPATRRALDLAAAPDVILVSVDTLRADRLGAYGSARSLTPELDRLAAEGFVFERTLAASPWTVPSVASLLTGLPTIAHGAGLPLGSGLTFLRSALDGEVVTVAERFSAAGYRTEAVVANGFLSPAMGMGQGFDRFDMPFSRATGSIFLRDIPLARLVIALYPVERWADYRARGLTDRALDILAAAHDEPLFLWVHYIDPHTPFQADPAKLDLEAWRVEILQDRPRVSADGTVVGEVFAGTSNVRSGMLWLGDADRALIEEYYDRAVAYVDAELGRLFAALRHAGRARDVVAAFTSDHGEEFWEHGRFEHGHDYYREVTRIPMILWGPGRVPVGRAGAEPVGLVDLAPTLLHLAGLDVPALDSPGAGSSLVPLWERGVAGEVDTAPSAAAPPGRIRFSEGNLYGLSSVLLEEGPWRFILRAHGAAELYHAFDDPLELVNRVAEHPERVARYRELLEPRLAALLESSDREAPVLDPETRKALQSLGYID